MQCLIRERGSREVSTALVRTWTPGWRIDIRSIVGAMRRGRGDPTLHIDSQGTVWWATSTPHGAGTLRLSSSGVREDIRAAAWGPGAEWLIDGVPTLLGSDDRSWREFRPHHAVLREALRRTPGWRVPRTRRPFDACVASVIEQKVTGVEARSAWRWLVTRFGDRAPGPTRPTGATTAGFPDHLVVPPSPAVWRDLPDWEYRRAGVTPQRVRTLRVVAAAASAIERTAELDGHAADGVLRSLPGVGMWTSAEVRQRAHGDSDAVSFGDFHVAKDICWWLTGETGDDARMASLLHEYAGHRYRVQRLMELSGGHAPRRGPRMPIPAHRFGT